MCFNIAVFDSNEAVMEFETVMKRDGIVDCIVELPTNFGIGDKYEDEAWIKTEPQQTNIPTIEERLTIAEDTINFLLGL